jgi:hypothetical protein
MRVADSIVLSEEVRRKLEQQSRGRSTQSSRHRVRFGYGHMNAWVRT